MIATKDSSQSKADKRIDRNLKSNKPAKFVPLMERNFNELITLKDQLRWLELKKKQKNLL